MQTGRERLIDLYMNKKITVSEFDPRMDQAKKRLSELETESRILQDREAEANDLRMALKQWEQFAAEVQASLNNADKTLQRELVRALIKRIEISENEARIVYRAISALLTKAPTGAICDIVSGVKPKHSKDSPTLFCGRHEFGTSTRCRTGASPRAITSRAPQIVGPP